MSLSPAALVLCPDFFGFFVKSVARGSLLGVFMSLERFLKDVLSLSGVRLGQGLLK